MPTITFEPFATLDEAKQAADFFGIELNNRTVGFAPVAALGKDGGNISSVSGCGVPGDVTLDPNRPEWWARAVYEAGKRDEASHWDGRRYSDEELGGVTQQPATGVRESSESDPYGIPQRTCDYCGKTDHVNNFAVPSDRGFRAQQCCKACLASGNDKQQQPVARSSGSEALPSLHYFDFRKFLWTGSLVLNGVEYRPVTPP